MSSGPQRSGPPALRRAVLYVSAFTIVAASVAFPLGGLGHALVAVGIFGGMSLIFYLLWIGWDSRPRRLRFHNAWLVVVLTMMLVFLVIDWSQSGLQEAVISIAPASVIVVISLILGWFLGTRAK